MMGVVSRSNEANPFGNSYGGTLFLNIKEMFNNTRKMLLLNSNIIISKVNKFLHCQKISPNFEIYSIDELFLDFHGFKYFNLEEYSKYQRPYFTENKNSRKYRELRPLKHWQK